MRAFIENMYTYMYLAYSAWTVNLHHCQDFAYITMNDMLIT